MDGSSDRISDHTLRDGASYRPGRRSSHLPGGPQLLSATLGDDVVLAAVFAAEERARRDEQIVGQAAELTRVTVKAESVQEELKATRVAREEQAFLRASQEREAAVAVRLSTQPSATVPGVHQGKARQSLEAYSVQGVFPRDVASDYRITPLLSGYAAAPKAPQTPGIRRRWPSEVGVCPIGTCIDVKAKRSAAMMHLGKDPDIVTNAEWMAYFQYALDDQALTSKNNMMSFHSKHPKNAVKALMEGIHPASLKAVVQIHLNLDQKHLRNSVLQFMVYVKTKLVAQLEFTWAAKSVGLVKAAGEDKPRQMDQAPKRARSLKKDVLRAFTGPNLLDVCVSASETEKEAIREEEVGQVGQQESTFRALKARNAPMLSEAEDPDDFKDGDSPEVEGDPRRLTGVIRLGRLLTDFEDVFRLEFQKDPPIALEPLKVRFIVDATPTTCEARRYLPLLTDYLRSH
ncbi:hypothetical protein H257_08682 [Aphanomyces astaci]|uniref:Uncharacterized protein n=1 Tax=Aphanomyces astaci TaxID=112090 RepID=W4GF42_APHAT|nr:hypothetical protein H257_08682 [Aphanomyces astaci]ETV77896.1 hypothetical protein H257_08682 [Aphanomyces astaci]|eukprot:XP_009833006.1 hypothetical protein H257_08682 [Aphanomyces astaci]